MANSFANIDTPPRPDSARYYWPFEVQITSKQNLYRIAPKARRPQGWPSSRLRKRFIQLSNQDFDDFNHQSLVETNLSTIVHREHSNQPAFSLTKSETESKDLPRLILV